MCEKCLKSSAAKAARAQERRADAYRAAAATQRPVVRQAKASASPARSSRPLVQEPPGSPSSRDRAMDGGQQAQALKAAAARGTPFCEECARAARRA